MGLYNLLARTAKKTLAVAGLAAILASGSAGAEETSSKPTRASARYEYSADSHTQLGRDQANNKRLDRASYEGTKRGELIDSVGSYSAKRLVEVREDTGLDFRTSLEVDRGKGNVTFSYSASPKTFGEELGPDKKFFGEDRAGTHVYLVLPKGAELKAVSQSVLAYNHKKEKSMNFFAMPLESYEFMKALEAANAFDDVVSLVEKAEAFNEGQFTGISIHLPSESTLEETFDSIVGKIPAGVGQAILYIKDFMKVAERERVIKIEERFPGCLVVPMPIYEPKRVPLGQGGCTPYGRKTKFFLDNSKVKAGERGRIIADLAFSRDLAGTTTLSNLDGLQYEFGIDPATGNLERIAEGAVESAPANHPIYGGWMTYSRLGDPLNGNTFLNIDVRGITIGEAAYWTPNDVGVSNPWGINPNGSFLKFPRREGTEYVMEEKRRDGTTKRTFFRSVSSNVLLTREEGSPYRASFKIPDSSQLSKLRRVRKEADSSVVFPQELYGDWVLDTSDGVPIEKWDSGIKIGESAKKGHVGISTNSWVKSAEQKVPDFKDYGGKQEGLRLKKEGLIQVDGSAVFECRGYENYGAKGVFENTANRIVTHQRQTDDGMAWLIRDGERIYIAFNSDYLKGPFVRKK